MLRLRTLLRKLKPVRYAQDKKYACAYIPIEGELRDKVLALAKQVPDEMLAEKGREDQPHCTILYGITENYPSFVADLLSRFKRPIRFGLGRVSVFEQDEYDVLKVDVASPDLLFLNALLRANLENEQEFKQYVPHATLAYVKKGQGGAIARALEGINEMGESSTVIFSDKDRTKTTISLCEKDCYSMSETPIRYAEGDAVHPAVKGFQLQYALEHLASDPNFTHDGRMLAKSVLTTGDPSGIWGLHDEMQDANHPLLDKYNWLNIPHKLLLDQAVDHAARAVYDRLRPAADGLPVPAPTDTHAHFHHRRALSSLAVENGHPNDLSVTLPHRLAAREAIKVLREQGHSQEDLEQSIRRHQSRMLNARGIHLNPEMEDDLRHDSVGPSEPVDGRSDPERYATEQKYDGNYDYDPLPEPVKPLTLREMIGKLKAKATKKAATPTPASIAKPVASAPVPISGYDTVNRKPINIADIYRQMDIPEKYAHSPALSDFIQAVRQVRSSQQEVRRSLAEAQYRKLKLKLAGLRDAIADSPQTASANTATILQHDGDLDKVRAAVSLYGLQTNSPSMLLHHEDENGPDFVFKMGTTGSGEKLRKRLDEAGFTNRVMMPTENGWDVLLHSPGGANNDRIAQFAQQNGMTPEISRGHSEVIGDSREAEGDESTRKTYRSIIKKYERSLSGADLSTPAPNERNPTSGQSARPNPTAAPESTPTGAGSFANAYAGISAG